MDHSVGKTAEPVYAIGDLLRRPKGLHHEKGAGIDIREGALFSHGQSFEDPFKEGSHIPDGIPGLSLVGVMIFEELGVEGGGGVGGEHVWYIMMANQSFLMSLHMV